MALRIDHLNKKLANHGVQLIRDDEGTLIFVAMDGEEITPAECGKLNEMTEAEWMAAAEAAHEQWLEEADKEEESDEDDSTMSGTLAKYRPGYVKTVNYSGTASVDNGDEVAELLRGLNPDETCAIADHLFGELPGTHFEKYQYLNKGQRRMNAGNRIRALIRRGEKTVDDLQAAIRGDDLVDDETAV